MSDRKKADQTAITHFKALGGDSQQDHPVEFFLYFTTEWDAYVVAAQLMNLQFSTTVDYTKNSDQWLCLATKKMTPTTERLLELGNDMERIANSNNGDYDGWGTPVFMEEESDEEV